MMNMSNTGAAVDLSSFILFEASGDSDEVDCYYDPSTDDIGRADDDDDDDDAESCRGSETCNCYDSDEDEKKEDEETEDELANDVYGRISYCSESDDEEQVQRQHESRAVLVDGKAGNRESLDETEKNRLFWEACLAS